MNNDKKLDMIISELQNIKLDIETIKDELLLVKKQTTKMNDHIDFVNDVYEKVETPMNFIVTKFNKMIGNDVQLIE